MITIISPAKKLDFSPDTRYTERHSFPDFMSDTEKLVEVLARKSEKQIAELMDLSSPLAVLNHERFQQFSFPFTPENAKQALLAFKGEVYLSFALEKYTEAEYEFAQNHLRILSGLYGLLRPMDLIQPYRLEMGTQLKTRRGKNLYEFWGDRITTALNGALEASGSSILINLASAEYYKSVKVKKLKAAVITPVFRDEKNGQYKTLFLYAKQARGAMADYITREKLTDPEEIKGFTGMGYCFHERLSTPTEWVFTR
ncbi:MAG: peroxide stress protein YaaA [Bacteroidia bacterium]